MGYSQPQWQGRDQPSATLSSLPLPSTSRLSLVTYLDSSSSPIPSSFTRFRVIGANRLFRTDVTEVSASFIPAVAARITVSVTSPFFDFMNYRINMISHNAQYNNYRSVSPEEY